MKNQSVISALVVLLSAGLSAGTAHAAPGAARVWGSHGTVSTTATVAAGPDAGSTATATTSATSGGVEAKILTNTGIWDLRASQTNSTTTRNDTPWSGQLAGVAGLLVGATQTPLTPSQIIPTPAPAPGSAESSSSMTAAQVSDSFPFVLGYAGMAASIAPSVSLGVTRVHRGTVGPLTTWGWGWGVSIHPGLTRRYGLYIRQAPLSVRGQLVQVSSPIIFGASFRPLARIAVAGGYSIPRVSGIPLPYRVRGGAWASVSWRLAGKYAARLVYSAGGRVCVLGQGCQSVRQLAPFWVADPARPVEDYERGLSLSLNYSPTPRVALSITGRYAPSLRAAATTLGVAQISPSGGALYGPVPVAVSSRSWELGGSLRVFF